MSCIVWSVERFDLTLIKILEKISTLNSTKYHDFARGGVDQTPLATDDVFSGNYEKENLW